MEQVARMSAATCGINANENPRMSLRSSALRLLFAQDRGQKGGTDRAIPSHALRFTLRIERNRNGVGYAEIIAVAS